MFKDRKDAGRKLGQALRKYKNKNVIVLAIPRGGVRVGFEVAKFLSSDFSLVITRKLPFPDETESGFGAVAEDGSSYILDSAYDWLGKDIINKILREQLKEVERRVGVLRGGKPLPDIKGRIVILTDDGLAMGSTMMAAITLCKRRTPKKIIVAVPVASRNVAEKVQQLADEVIVLEKPRNFYAVAQVYENWHDVSDEEALQIMIKWKKKDQVTLLII